MGTFVWGLDDLFDIKTQRLAEIVRKSSLGWGVKEGSV